MEISNQPKKKKKRLCFSVCWSFIHPLTFKNNAKFVFKCLPGNQFVLSYKDSDMTIHLRPIHFAMDVHARCHFTTRDLKCGQLAWATVICNGVGSHYGVKEMLLLGSEGIQRQMRARIWALASLIKCAIKCVLVWRQTADLYNLLL